MAARLLEDGNVRLLEDGHARFLEDLSAPSASTADTRALVGRLEGVVSLEGSLA